MKQIFAHGCDGGFVLVLNNGHAFGSITITLIIIMRTISNYFSKTAFVFISIFISLVSFAQEKKEVDINVNTKGNNWYAQPWVWIVGAAVFIIIIVALLKKK